MSLKGWPQSGLLGLSTCAMLACVATATAREPVAVLTPSDVPASSGRFGYAVAVSGDWIVVGAPFDGELDRGAVYVFRREGGGWVEDAKLVPSSEGDHDLFGQAVSVDGEVLVVGAPATMPEYLRRGAAYVYRRVGGGWIEEAILRSDWDDYRDDFGFSVSVDANTVVVGNVREIPDAAAYVYVRNATTWVREGKLTEGVRPGWSVSVSGDLMVTGDPTDNGAGDDAGTAYVYRREGGTWILDQQLSASDAQPFDQFGASVGLFGELAVVGAPLEGSATGAAYAFRYTGTEWVEETKLAEVPGEFGQSVAIREKVMVVGARLASRGDLYQRMPNTWMHLDRLDAVPPQSGEQAGYSVALDGDVSVVGTAWGERALVYDVGDAVIGIPTVSESGLVVLGIMLLIVGRIVLPRTSQAGRLRAP